MCGRRAACAKITVSEGHPGELWIAHLQGEALGYFVRVFLGAPFALEDGVPHDVEGVGAAQATKVAECHRC
jgi:hypothetical protein